MYQESKVHNPTLHGFRTRVREYLVGESSGEGISGSSDQREPGESDRQYKGPPIE